MKATSKKKVQDEEGGKEKGQFFVQKSGREGGFGAESRRFAQVTDTAILYT